MGFLYKTTEEYVAHLEIGDDNRSELNLQAVSEELNRLVTGAYKNSCPVNFVTLSPDVLW